MLPEARFLLEFLRGHHDPVQTIAWVPGEFSARIHARTSNLLLERDYGRKFRVKHGFNYRHFQLIQPIIDNGYVILERRSSAAPADLVFAFIGDAPFDDAIFVLAVKEAANGEEIWLKSFHRIDRARLRRLVRNHEVLRDHAE